MYWMVQPVSINKKKSSH